MIKLIKAMTTDIVTGENNNLIDLVTCPERNTVSF